MKEQWKPITGFEEYYHISNLGRVFSVRFNIVMKTYINNNGYECIKFTIQGNRFNYLIHRLVARDFCIGYKEDLVVNHKDGNRLNNVATNLEWCTAKENIYNMKTRGTMNFTKAQNIAKIKNQKAVIVTTPQGEILEFPSIKIACETLNLSSSKGSMVANNLRVHHKGYKFKFKLDDDIV